MWPVFYIQHKTNPENISPCAWWMKLVPASSGSGWGRHSFREGRNEQLATCWESNCVVWLPAVLLLKMTQSKRPNAVLWEGLVCHHISEQTTQESQALGPGKAEVDGHALRWRMLIFVRSEEGSRALQPGSICTNESSNSPEERKTKVPIYPQQNTDKFSSATLPGDCSVIKILFQMQWTFHIWKWPVFWVSQRDRSIKSSLSDLRTHQSEAWRGVGRMRMWERVVWTVDYLIKWSFSSLKNMWPFLSPKHNKRTSV